MSDLEELFQSEGEDAVLVRVHIQPGAGRTAVVGRHGTALKVRVAAAPEGGRANEACAALLAETFGVAGGDVEVIGGTSSRQKRFRLKGVDLDEFRRRLEQAVAEGQPGQGPRSGPDGRPPGKR